MKTGETPKSIEIRINPARLIYFYAAAFIVLWAIIITAVLTVDRLMGWLTK